MPTPGEVLREQQYAMVRELLEGVSNLELRELCIEALRRARVRWPNERSPDVRTQLGGELVPLLAQRRGVQVDLANFSMEPFWRAQLEPFMDGIVEFLQWFERAGLGLLMWAESRILKLVPTQRGFRFLDQRDREHPLLPGAVERVVGRCPGLPNEVVALLADVRECLDHALLRPAIALLGVAYEVLIETIFDSLVDRRLITANIDARAARRIELIRISLDTALPGNTAEARDERSAARNALDFADQLRRRRNQASHTRPTWGFEDRSEVEDMFVLAIGGLPALWRLHAPAAP